MLTVLGTRPRLRGGQFSARCPARRTRWGTSLADETLANAAGGRSPTATPAPELRLSDHSTGTLTLHDDRPGSWSDPSADVELALNAAGDRTTRSVPKEADSASVPSIVGWSVSACASSGPLESSAARRACRCCGACIVAA